MARRSNRRSAATGPTCCGVSGAGVLGGGSEAHRLVPGFKRSGAAWEVARAPMKRTSGMAVDAPRSGLTWLLGLRAAGWLKRVATERPAVLARGPSTAWPKRGPCIRGPWPRGGGASTSGPGWRRLTFELTPTAEADADWPRRDDDRSGPERPGGGCRSGSGVERGVRRQRGATCTLPK
jgi:hypothetical protein